MKTTTPIPINQKQLKLTGSTTSVSLVVYQETISYKPQMSPNTIHKFPKMAPIKDFFECFKHDTCYN